jgi:outer membrane protein assembly factor BamB
VIHPRGKVLTPDGESTKPVPEGVDTWSHLYHGPDNNPRSQDHTARAPYLTQFLADPLFCPMPEVSVAGGGRVYRAFGHIAHKANQNPMLNTLICVNAYNGTILWTRALSAGFMIHRCTMIATDDVLYLADDQSCKRIDGATGRVLDEIVVPDGMGDGRVWKWMALVDGVLYALVGAEEIHVDSQPSQVRGLGHWPWGMWQGHDYADPRTSFGYGRTFVAFDVATREVLWSHDETEYLDSRGVCMSEGRIFYYAPDRFLGCLGVDGQVDWKSDNADLLAAIGSHGKAQHYVTGYATTSYIKSNRDYILFAGPQRNQLVVARAADGQLLWAREPGNLQLVLEQDGFYAAGPQQPGAPGVPENGAKLAYEDGRVLARLPMRRACTRATGTDDSIFYRASGGTVRLDKATNQARHIAPMRPPCQDGVIVSDGNLYWGPWMCGCQLSLYGHIALTSAGDFEFCPPVDEQRLTTFSDGSAIQPLEVQANDWPAYQADNSRSATTQLDLDSPYAADWEFALSQAAFPTAPIAAGDRVFFGDRNGFVYALNAADGQQVWRAATGGAIFFPPALHEGRLFVGSADGRVYAFEAVTGRRLWTFRAAPAERWIPVYGRLTSTWPVAGGVVVDNGVVYAAAGIAHYDGTHVFALDAETGAVKWSNDRSGTTSEQADHGVSLQGVLSIRDGELRFAGGGVHEEARYDLSSGECLNESDGLPRSRFHTAFYAHFPDYGKYVSLETPLEDGRSLCYDCTYEGSWHSSLTLQPAGAARGPKPLSRWGLQGRRGAGGDRGLEGRLFGGFVVGRKAALAAGHADGDDPAESSLISIGLEQADPRWSLPLGGPVVKGGLAVNARGQVFVSLENGRIRAFSAATRAVPPAS